MEFYFWEAENKVIEKAEWEAEFEAEKSPFGHSHCPMGSTLTISLPIKCVQTFSLKKKLNNKLKLKQIWCHLEDKVLS